MPGRVRTPPPLVLASASPRRSRILTRLGLAHEVLPSDILEEPLPGEGPEAHVWRLAREKALAVCSRRADSLVLGCDTIVTLEGRILGKPTGPAQAVEMLLDLAGSTHTVLSGLAVVAPGGRLHAGVSRTEVTFRPFGEAEARAYVATGEPLDKAGAYGIQDMGAALVAGIRGDYWNVVGLPIPELLGLLEAAGWRYQFGRLEPVPG